MERIPLAKSILADSLTEVCRISASGYSTGSSSVMMLTDSVLMWFSTEYRVVVLPLPVGPVTSTMPSGLAMIILSRLSAASSRPSPSSDTMPFCRSRMRSTRFSPCVVGCEATRKSIGRPDKRSEMRPSCGARVSAMFMLLITFRRTTMAGQKLLCRLRTWRSTPSTR